MKAGELRHKLTIQKKTVTSTGDRGQPVYTWTDDVVHVPAKIVSLTGRKLELARQLVAEATHEITIRYISSFDITKRLKDSDGKIYNVGNVSDRDNLHFTLTLTCMSQESGA